MRIGGYVYIVGATKTNIQVLDKVKESDLEVLPLADVSNAFNGVLHKYFKKQSYSHEKERHEEHDQA